MEEIKDWHYCYECGCELFGVPPEDDKDCITVMKGDCKRCGKKDAYLIPVADFTGRGD